MQLQDLQTYRKAVLSAFADVEKALIALQKFTLQERLQNDVVAASRKAFDVAEDAVARRHRQSDHRAADPADAVHRREQLVLVRLNKLLAASSLFQALGGGWTPAGTLAAVDDEAAMRDDASSRGRIDHAHGESAGTGRHHGPDRRSVAGSAPACAAADATQQGTVPLTFGMTPDQASQALGVPLHYVRGTSGRRAPGRAAQCEGRDAGEPQRRALSAIPARTS